MFKKLLTVFLMMSGTVISARAQNMFRYKADLESIKQSGFYKIYLNPSVVAKGNADLSDIRIIDEKRNFVPYVRMQNLPSATENLVNFPVLETSKKNDSITSILIENTKSLLLRSLWLKLKNTAVSRKVDVLGSDDKLKWFALEEDVLLGRSSGSSTDNYLQSLSFPASNYRYFKLNINNKGKSPIKILQAGIYSSDTSAPKFTMLPQPAVTRIDSSNKITYLNLNFRDKFQVNKLVISVSHPKYYRRSVLVYELIGREKFFLTEVDLNSDTKPEIVFSSKAKNLQLQIQNGDNPALEISTIQAYQLNEYILAYLEPAKAYQLLVGNRKVQQPDYDLKFFTDSALRNVSEIEHSQLVKNPLFLIAPTKTKRDYTALLWVAIASVLALLGFLTYRMMTALKTQT